MNPRPTRYKPQKKESTENISIAFGFFGIIYFIVHLAIHL